MPRELYPSESRKIREMLKQGFTDREISKALHVARASISRLRNESQGYIEQPLEQQPETTEYVDHSNVQPESYDQELDDRQDTDLEDEIEDDEQETDQEEDSEPKQWEYVEVTECPRCGKPIDDCLTKNEAFSQNIGINPTFEDFFDYCCPNCAIWFPEKRLCVPGICPGSGCGSTSIDWVPIEQLPNATEEEIEKYDFICSNCTELINIDDL